MSHCHKCYENKQRRARMISVREYEKVFKKAWSKRLLWGDDIWMKSLLNEVRERSHVQGERKSSQQRKEPVHWPYNWNVLCRTKEQRGQCYWVRVREEERMKTGNSRSNQEPVTEHLHAWAKGLGISLSEESQPLESWEQEVVWLEILWFIA